MFVIYHDPSCIYSNICLSVLRSKKITFKKIEYKKEALTVDVLKELVSKLAITPKDLVNKKNRQWKKYFSHLDLTDEEIYYLLLSDQSMLVKPIIVDGDKAIIGRPPKNLLKMLKEKRLNNLSIKRGHPV